MKKLTIAIITMNRSKQLLRALQSCELSNLPPQTEYLIIDNASTDDTESTVEMFSQSTRCDVRYYKQNENKGVGQGRNICFDLAEGEYIYFMDDDAIISENSRNTFFVECARLMDANRSIATISTAIDDRFWGKRIPIFAKHWRIEGRPCVYAFSGGSVFIRKSAFSSPLFLRIMYGNEEITPSVYAVEKGMFNIFDDTVSIDHLPEVNKWQGKQGEGIVFDGILNILVIKKLLYPKCFSFALSMACYIRCKKHAINYEDIIEKKMLRRQEIVENGCIKKVSVPTIIKCLKEFGLSAL